MEDKNNMSPEERFRIEQRQKAKELENMQNGTTQPQQPTPEEIIAQYKKQYQPDYGEQPVYQEEDEFGVPVQQQQNQSGRFNMPRGAGGYTQYVIMIIIAIVITFGMTNFITPMAGKKSYQADITRLELDLVAMRETDTKLKNSIEEVSSEIGGLKGEISQAITEEMSNVKEGIREDLAQFGEEIVNMRNDINEYDNEAVASVRQSITTLQDDIKSMNNDISNLNSGIDAFKTDINAKIEDINTTIADIEVNGTGGEATNVNGVLTANVKAFSDSLYISSNTSAKSSFKLVLENKSDHDIEDVIIRATVRVNTYSYLPSNIGLYGGTQWQPVGSGSNYIMYVNAGWGLSVEAGKKKTMYPEITVTFPNDTPNLRNLFPLGIPYTVEVEIDSYD